MQSQSAAFEFKAFHVARWTSALNIAMIDGLSDESLGQLISERLRPDRDSRPQTIQAGNRMSPTLAYGRHRGPARNRSRIAAVAVALFRRGNVWMVPTTLRPKFLMHHGGQICLPGGRVETGEDVCQAARREFHEELGVECRIKQICGQLSTQYVYASDNVVHPIVMIIEAPTQPWKPDPSEVEQVIEIPLSRLLATNCRTTVVREKSVCQGGAVVDVMSFRAPAFIAHVPELPSQVGTPLTQVESPIESSGPVIWGATAMILDQLAHLLR
jgi:8-oxo-dGTP pyrophosphatase MutT (NUDIX family)